MNVWVEVYPPGAVLEVSAYRRPHLGRYPPRQVELRGTENKVLVDREQLRPHLEWKREHGGPVCRWHGCGWPLTEHSGTCPLAEPIPEPDWTAPQGVSRG